MPLSAKTLEHLALVWECFETEPKINYEKFRALANLASAHSARELLRVAKKKLREEYGGGGGGSTTGAGTIAPASSPASTKKRGPKPAVPAARGAKRKRRASDDDEDDDLVLPSPGGLALRNDDSDFELFESPVRKKAKPARKSNRKEKVTAAGTSSAGAPPSSAKKHAASSATAKTTVQIKPEPREDSVVLEAIPEPKAIGGQASLPELEDQASGAASPIQYTFDLGFEEEQGNQD